MEFNKHRLTIMLKISGCHQREQEVGYFTLTANVGLLSGGSRVDTAVGVWLVKEISLKPGSSAFIPHYNSCCHRLSILDVLLGEEAVVYCHHSAAWNNWSTANIAVNGWSACILTSFLLCR